MLECERRLFGPALGLVVALAGLMGCGDADLGLSGFGLPGGDVGEHWCFTQRWGVFADFTTEQVPAPPPDELRTATLRVGETVLLEVDPPGNDCGTAVERVEWISSRPDVARVVPTDHLTADLQAQGPGEAVVEAEVTLVDGQRKRVGLHVGPLGLLPVFAVRVIP